MGEFNKPRYAYMVPVIDGEVPDSDISKPYYTIYKIPVSGIETFQKAYSNVGFTWKAFYNFEDSTDYILFDD